VLGEAGEQGELGQGELLGEPAPGLISREREQIGRQIVEDRWSLPTVAAGG
jgi:hypothetical protein